MDSKIPLPFQVKTQKLNVQQRIKLNNDMRGGFNFVQNIYIQKPGINRD